MLVQVRIRDAISTVSHPAHLVKPAALAAISDTIKLGIDETATKFGVSCPLFKINAVCPADHPKLLPSSQPKSLNLADASLIAPDYYSGEIESVLPELPNDTRIPPLQLPPQPSPPDPPIVYPQAPIVYPQPPQITPTMSPLPNFSPHPNEQDNQKHIGDANATPLGALVSRHVLYAPPPSPSLITAESETGSTTFPVLLSRALSAETKGEQPLPDSLPKEIQLSSVSPSAGMSSPLAQYLDGLPPTPSSELPSSEAGSETPVEERKLVIPPPPALLPTLESDRQNVINDPFEDAPGAPLHSGTPFPAEGFNVDTFRQAAQLINANPDHPNQPLWSTNGTNGVESRELVLSSKYMSQMNNPFEEEDDDSVTVEEHHTNGALKKNLPMSLTRVPNGAGIRSGEESGYSSTEAVNGKEVDVDSDEAIKPTHTALQTTDSSMRRDPRKLRQQLATTSIFHSVVEKAERALKTAGATIATDFIDAPMRLINSQSTTHRIKGPSTSKSSRHGTSENSTVQRSMGSRYGGRAASHGKLRDVAFSSESHREEMIRDGKLSRAESCSDIRTRDLSRPQSPLERVARERRDGTLRKSDERLRSTEEQDMLSRREHSRREKLMGALDSIENSKVGRGAAMESSDGSTEVWLNATSDSDRERFNGEDRPRDGSRSRRRRSKSRRHRRPSRYAEEEVARGGSSSEDMCLECGHHREHDSLGHLEKHRSGSNRNRSHIHSHTHSRSKRGVTPHDASLEYYSDNQSPSRSRGTGRERKTSSDRSVESHRSGRHSSRDRPHRSRKGSSRDSKADREGSSSGRSKGSDRKRSHSRGRSSSKKNSRELEPEKRKKESKGKSKNRQRKVPIPSASDYIFKNPGLTPIYHHRLPESDSGQENPIPWYCEGQSQPDESDIEEDHRRKRHGHHHSSESDTHGLHLARSSMKFSSYGRRDRYGRRHRARHHRTVRFLYDDL